jgi:hypothetical protein
MKEDHGEHGNSTQAIDVPSMLHDRNDLPRRKCAKPLSILPICVTLAQTPFVRCSLSDPIADEAGSCRP